ncbi:MAG: helix-turn-helix domain-containing protein [Acidimicrobiales bacterium]
MTLVHRHLDIAPGTPPEDLPLDALDDLLDRGSFDDWRSLAGAIRCSPYGPLAERVLTLCRVHDMYGTSQLWPGFIDRVRSAPNDAPPQPSLAELRKARGRTQTHMAKALGISQSDVSKLEYRTDLRLSTLRRYLKALGGDLQVSARFPGEDPVALSITDRRAPLVGRRVA